MRSRVFTLPRPSLLLALIYLRLHVADSIECYQCADPGPENQGHCLNHKNRAQTVTCDDKYRPVCYSSSFIYPDKKRSTGIELGCISAWQLDISLVNMTKPECRTFNKNDDKITDGRICFCNTNKCNMIRNYARSEDPSRSLGVKNSRITKLHLLLAIFSTTKIFYILHQFTV